MAKKKQTATPKSTTPADDPMLSTGETAAVEIDDRLIPVEDSEEQWIVELKAFLHVGGAEMFREVVVIGKTAENNIIIRGSGGDEVVPWHRVYAAPVDLGGKKLHYPKFEYDKALAAEVSGSGSV